MCYHYIIVVRCRTCRREVESWPESTCLANEKEHTQRLNPQDRCWVGKKSFDYPRKDILIPGMKYYYDDKFNDSECDACWLERHNNPGPAPKIGGSIYKGLHKGNLGGTADGKASKTESAPKLVRRGPLTLDEKRERKAKVEALFNDPKALEMQQMLLGEAMNRMRVSD